MIDTWFFADKIGEDGSGNASLVISESSWERAKEMATAIAREQLTSDVSDVNENAVQFIVDWVTSNNNYFGTNSTGKYYGEFTSNKEEVYILPSALNEALKAAGFSPRKTMKYLADNDFIEVREKSGAGGKSYQVLKRFNGPPQRAIHFYIKKVIDNEEIDRTSTRKNMKKEDVEFKQENFVTKDGFVRVPDDEDLPF